MIVSVQIQVLSEDFLIVWLSEEEYIKVMFLADNMILLQHKEDTLQYLLQIVKLDKEGNYRYSYYEGLYLGRNFNKKKHIFSGNLFHDTSDSTFNCRDWLKVLAIKIAADEGLDFPVNCLSIYGLDTPYKITRSLPFTVQ